MMIQMYRYAASIAARYTRDSSVFNYSSSILIPVRAFKKTRRGHDAARHIANEI